MAMSLHTAGDHQLCGGPQIAPHWDAPTHWGPYGPAKTMPARGDQGHGNKKWKQHRSAQPWGDTIPALSPAVGPIPRSRIKATQPDPLPGAARHGTHPVSPPWGEGAPTLDTVMGFPKSLPPVMRKPQGAGPAKVTVTGMAAGGSGRAGSGGVGKSRGALCSSGRHSPAAPAAPHPEGPKHG